MILGKDAHRSRALFWDDLKYNTPGHLNHRLRWIRCLKGKGIQETNDGEQA